MISNISLTQLFDYKACKYLGDFPDTIYLETSLRDYMIPYYKNLLFKFILISLNILINFIVCKYSHFYYTDITRINTHSEMSACKVVNLKQCCINYKWSQNALYNAEINFYLFFNTSKLKLYVLSSHAYFKTKPSQWFSRVFFSVVKIIVV